MRVLPVLLQVAAIIVDVRNWATNNRQISYDTGPTANETLFGT